MSNPNSEPSLQFDLQFFAGDGGEADTGGTSDTGSGGNENPASASAAGSSQTPASNASASEAAQTGEVSAEAAPQVRRYGLVKEANGRSKVVEIPPAPVQSQTGEGNDPSTNEAPYTPDEIAQIGIDKLDPKRIPNEMVPFYQSMMEEFNRRTQSLAEQRQKFEEQGRTQNVQPPVQDQQPPPQQQQDQTASHQQISVKDFAQMIQQKALEQFVGEIKEEYDDYNPEHRLALQVIQSNIMDALRERQAQIQAEESQAQEQRQKVERSKAVYQEFRDRDQNAAAIEEYAAEKFENMPYRQAQAIRQAAQNGDAETLRKFIDDCRAEWYAKQAGKKVAASGGEAKANKKAPTPPPTEAGGQGDSAPKEPFDWKQLRSMKPSQRAQLFQEMYDKKGGM